MFKHEALQQQVQSILKHVNAMLDNKELLNTMQIESLEKIQRNTSTFVESFDLKQAAELNVFVSYLNHEAFNYITPILGYSELVAMQAQGALSNEQRETMDELCDIAYALRDELRRIHQNALQQQQTNSS